MPTTRYDYPALRTEFISADPPITINELCTLHGIPQGRRSSIQKMAEKEGWREQRDMRVAKTTTTVNDEIALRLAQRQLRRLEIEDNGLEAVDEAITKMRSDMKRTKREKDPVTLEWVTVPLVTYRPEQIVQLIDRLDTLFGTVAPAPAPSDDAKNLTQINFGSFDGNDPAHRQLAADVVAATRSVGGSARGASSASPLPSAPDSRPDE